MNVVDSCAWLEYFADGPNAGEFAAVIEDTDHCVVPAICIYEVFRRMSLQLGESIAFEAVAAMRRCRVVALDEELAVAAAQVARLHRLPMADAVIYATSQRCSAALWTQDGHFEGKAGVEYREPVKLAG